LTLNSSISISSEILEQWTQRAADSLGKLLSIRSPLTSGNHPPAHIEYVCKVSRTQKFTTHAALSNEVAHIPKEE